MDIRIIKGNRTGFMACGRAAGRERERREGSWVTGLDVCPGRVLGCEYWNRGCVHM